MGKSVVNEGLSNAIYIVQNGNCPGKNGVLPHNLSTSPFFGGVQTEGSGGSYFSLKTCACFEPEDPGPLV